MAETVNVALQEVLGKGVQDGLEEESLEPEGQVWRDKACPEMMRPTGMERLELTVLPGNVGGKAGIDERGGGQ